MIKSFINLKIRIYKNKQLNIMATTPEQFFTKNMKWIALILLFLVLFKFVQGCNRNMGSSIKEKQYIHTIDSLNKKYNNLKEESTDSIKKLNFQLELAGQQVKSANEKANAVQSAVEKLRSNTTITVRGAEEVKDTSKKK
jgi:hypothetical protein